MGSKSSSERGDEPARGSRQPWPAELRVQLARAIVERGESGKGLSRLLGIPLNTLQDWAARYMRDGPRGVSINAREGTAKKATAGQTRGRERTREAVITARRNHPEHGTRRIRDELSRFEGLPVSEQGVRRILHEAGMVERVTASGKTPARASVL